MAAPTRVSVLVVDQSMVAHGLGRLVADEADLEVKGVAATGAAAVRSAQQYQPAVVLVADRLPDMAGSAVAAAVTRAVPETKVILLTAADPRPLLVEAQRTGCSAVLSKTQTVAELLAAIRCVHDGVHLIEPPTDGDGDHALSPRELDVLALLVDGADTERIARELYLSVNTVRNHIQHTIRKLGVHSRLEAVTEAGRRGIISRP